MSDTQQQLYNPQGELVHNDYYAKVQSIEPMQTYPMYNQDYSEFVINPNQVGYGTRDQKNKFIRTITGIWVLQEIGQIIFSFLALYNSNYDKAFFNYDTESHKAFYYILAIIWVSTLVTARFISRKKINVIYGIFGIYVLSYMFFISGCVSGGHESIDKGIRLSFFVGFLFFMITLVNLITLLGLFIGFVISKKEPTYTNKLKYILLAPIPVTFILIAINGGDGLQIAMMFIGAECLAVVFGSLYLYSILAIRDGKFKLKNDEFLLGSMLVYFNMFLPCIE